MSVYVIFIISRELCAFKSRIARNFASNELNVKRICIYPWLYYRHICITYIRNKQQRSTVELPGACIVVPVVQMEVRTRRQWNWPTTFGNLAYLRIRVIHSRSSRVLISESVYAVSRNAMKCRRWNVVDNGHTKRDWKIARYTYIYIHTSAH